jgi:hypothetical protein
MRGALMKCLTTFNYYAQLHFAKETPDGDEKARRNVKLAQMCDAALAGVIEPPAVELVERVAKVLHDYPYQGRFNYEGQARAVLTALRSSTPEGERAQIVDWLRKPERKSVATMDKVWSAAYNACLEHVAKFIERGDHLPPPPASEGESR